jgi:cellulose biosynthesis protein BcsQ
MRAAFDTMIVDTGGKDTRDLREVIAIADKTVVSIKPSPADLRTLLNFVDFIRRINGALDVPKDVRVVMTMSTGRATNIGVSSTASTNSATLCACSIPGSPSASFIRTPMRRAEAATSSAEASTTRRPPQRSKTCTTRFRQ